MVDTDSEILEWEVSEVAEQENVDNNIEAISPFEAKKYVGMPIGKINLGMGRNEVGFQVLSNLTINQFIDLWGKFRTEKEWRFLRPAEMQGSPTAIPIGFCAGSSPKKLTKILNEKLAEDIGLAGQVKLEVSWQTIRKEDIGTKMSNKLWKRAAEKRDKETPSGMNKNSFFNLYAPAALIVYVSDVRFENKSKVLMMKFGRGKKVTDWAVWPDGSMMRFVPFLQPTCSLRNREKLEVMLDYQIHSRIQETKRDIDIIDIYSDQEYLGGKCLHEVLLRIQSKKILGSPVFKHITKKWTRNYLDTYYQVTSFSSLTAEANEVVENLMATLVDEFGHEVSRHFPTGSFFPVSPTSTMNFRRKEEDPEIERLFGEAEVGVENILEPGWLSTIEIQEAGLIQPNEATKAFQDGESTIQLTSSPIKDANLNKTEIGVHAKPSTDERSIEESLRDQISFLTEDSSSIEDSLDEDTVVTNNSTKSTTTEAKKVWKKAKLIRKKMADLKITDSDLEKWKRENKSTVATLEAVTKSQYSLQNAILKLMTLEPTKQPSGPDDALPRP